MINPQDHERLEQEFLLSQYLDGDLDEQARVELEARLRADVHLAALLEDLRRTDALVRSTAGPVPDLDWERFAGQVSTACRRADALGRRRRVLRLWAPLAAAAALAMAVTLHLAMPRTDRPGGDSSRIAVVSVGRADLWQVAPDRAEPYTRVSFDRSQPSIQDPRRIPGTTVAIAVVGAGPTPTDTPDVPATPYF